MVSGTAAAGHCQTRDLSQAASDESCDGIVTESEPVAHSRRDRDNIFQRAAEFHSHDIVVGIKTESGIAEFALHGLREFGIFRRHGDGRRIAACHFLGERWPTQRSDPRRKTRRDDLRGYFGHPQERGLFQSLGCAYEKHCRLKMRQHLLKQSTTVLRRHDADHNLRAVQSFLKAAGGRDGCRDQLSGKKQFVDATGRDRIADFLSRAPTAALHDCRCVPARWRGPCPTLLPR